MESLLVINASAENWTLGLQQETQVIGFPARWYPTNIPILRRLGLSHGALFLAISNHRAHFVGRVRGEPFLSKLPVWEQRDYPLRIRLRVMRPLSGKWYLGSDTRNVLQHLFLRTLYSLEVADLEERGICRRTLMPAIDIVQQTLRAAAQQSQNQA